MNLTPIEVIRLYASGLNLRQVGERAGCSHEAVRRCLLRAGVTLAPPHVSYAKERRLGDLALELAADLEDAFPNGASVNSLMDWTGEPMANVKHALGELMAAGWVEPVAGGFVLIEQGRAAA